MRVQIGQSPVLYFHYQVVMLGLHSGLAFIHAGPGAHVSSRTRTLHARAHPRICVHAFTHCAVQLRAHRVTHVRACVHARLHASACACARFHASACTCVRACTHGSTHLRVRVHLLARLRAHARARVHGFTHLRARVHGSAHPCAPGSSPRSRPAFQRRPKEGQKGGRRERLDETTEAIPRRERHISTRLSGRAPPRLPSTSAPCMRNAGPFRRRTATAAATAAPTGTLLPGHTRGAAKWAMSDHHSLGFGYK